VTRLGERAHNPASPAVCVRGIRDKNISVNDDSRSGDDIVTHAASVATARPLAHKITGEIGCGLAATSARALRRASNAVLTRGVSSCVMHRFQA
jgi:hypothetical protein